VEFTDGKVDRFIDRNSKTTFKGPRNTEEMKHFKFYKEFNKEGPLNCSYLDSEKAGESERKMVVEFSLPRTTRGPPNASSVSFSPFQG
jgi:hypothetical protein